MLLLDGAVEGVLVAEDDVHLVGAAALIGAEHDGVGRVAVERLGGEVVRGGEELEIGAAAVEPILKGHLVLEHETLRGVEGLREEGRDAVVTRGGVHVQALILGLVRHDDGGDA